MEDLNNSEQYWEEVNGLAANIATEAMQATENDREEAEELINDTMLHGVVDGHQWVIYTVYHLPVLQYSDNEEYMTDNFGDAYTGSMISEGGLSHLHMAMAFWALYADVQDNIHTYLDQIEEGEE